MNKFLDFLAEVAKTAVVLGLITAMLSYALFHVLGINPFGR